MSKKDTYGITERLAQVREPLISVKFVQSHHGYSAGEVAGFVKEKVEFLLKKKKVVLLNEKDLHLTEVMVHEKRSETAEKTKATKTSSNTEDVDGGQHDNKTSGKRADKASSSKVIQDYKTKMNTARAGKGH